MKYVYILVVLCLSFRLYGQKENLDPCGTVNEKSEWLKNYQKDPTKFDKRSGEIIWVPISITIVGFDDGSGYIGERTVHESMCTLNEDYAETEIQFYLAKPLRYINNSRYADHGNVLIGAEMMFENNYPNMINNYIMNSAAGNCGYNLPYAGIALANNCTSPEDHTWAHEIGHALSLPHPFLGWEGGVSHNGSISHNFNNPAPDKVAYDYTLFQDTLIVDTLIIDTAYVERVDGSNCTFAADGFCDTKPDYLAQRWNCNANGESSIEQTDPNGEKFFSDASLFMSYATDDCSYRFTPDQIAAMRANLIDEKSSYLGNEDVLQEVADTEVEVLAPGYLDQVYFEDVYIEWEPVENATAYTIQVARTASYGLTVFDTLITDPFITLPPLRFPTKKHYFRVKALNEYDFCSEFIAFGAFEGVDEQTNVNDRFLSTIKINPSLLKSGESIQIENKEGYKLTISVTNLVGQSLFSEETSQRFTQIATDDWSDGIYVVTFRMGRAVITKKVALTK